MEPITFIDYNGVEQTIGLCELLSIYTGAPYAITGRVGGTSEYDDYGHLGKRRIRIWWTHNSGNNAFNIESYFTLENIIQDKITKTDVAIPDDKGVDRSAWLIENLRSFGTNSPYSSYYKK